MKFWDGKINREYLTPGELRVYDVLISSGWSNQKIAEELSLSVGAVKVYMTKVMRFYGVRDRSELIAGALWPRIRGLETENRNLREELQRAA